MTKFLTLLLFITLPLLLSSQVTETLVTDTSQIRIAVYEPGDTTYLLKNFTDGNWIIYYDKSKKQKALDRTIINKKSSGTDRCWYRNGQLKEEVIWPGDGTEFNHTSNEWYSDGKVKHTHKCPKDTCISLYYYHNGKLKKKELSVGPALVYAEEYCENGQLKYTPFNPNAREKVAVTNYFCNGKKQYQYNWVAGIYAGDYKEWDENGTLLIKGQYDDDPEKIKSIFSGDWVNLDKTGTWQYFDVNGKLVKEELYKDGQIIKTTQK